MKTLIYFCTLLFMTAQLYSQDWSNLQRYKDENLKLMNSPQDSLRVVFMGNSITEGWINHSPEFFEENGFINRGISGQTTPQMLLRFRQDVIDLNPSIVVILAGINDIAGNTGPMTIDMIMNNYKSMVELARYHGIKVIVCSVLPASKFNWRPEIKPAQQVLELNKLLESTTESSDMIYVDYHSAMKNDNNGLRANLGEDGVHPNAKGYAIMEPLVLDAIHKLRSNE